MKKKHLKKRKTLLIKILVIISFICPVLSCFLVGIVFSDHPSVKQHFLASEISVASKKNNDAKVFLKYSVIDDEKNISRNIFLGVYPQNFLYSTQFLTVSEEDSFEPASFSLSNDAGAIKEKISIVDGCTYSNQEKLLRFETLCMNIYTFRQRALETYAGGCDGFMYIPDYVADRIIEQSSGRLKYYDDLLVDGDVPEELADLLIIKIKHKDDQIKTFKIANVFHVDGYNHDYFKDGNDSDAHVINDYNYGSIMKRFIGDFCVAYSYDFIRNNSYSICAAINTQPYTINDYATTISRGGKHFVDGMFYTVFNNDCIEIKQSSDYFATISTKYSDEIGHVILAALAFSFVVASIIGCFFVIRLVFYSFQQERRYLVIHFLILLGVNIFLYILSTVLEKIVNYHLYFYSQYYGLASLVVLTGFVALLLLSIYKRRPIR